MPYPRTGKPAAVAAHAGHAVPGRRHHAHRAGAAVAIGRPAVPGLHRALRLVVGTGIAAAGLCLVIGLTALVIRIGGQAGSGRPVAVPDAIGAAGRHDRLLVPVPSREQDMRHLVRTVHVYRGDGRGRRGPFRIGSPGTWGLTWAFSCGPAHDGQFTATGHSPVTGTDIAVAASGPSGHGITWASSDPGRHIVTVNSRCAWTIRVVLPPSHA